MTGSRVRTGAVLLEVLVAMTIFAIASTATLARAAEARRSVALAWGAEEHMIAASAFLDHVALWPREDLDRHLGTHSQGVWALDVEHPAPALYTLTLLEGTSGHVLLETVLYRSASSAPPRP